MSNSHLAVFHQSLLVRLLAQFFSYAFHPLFIPLYVSWFLAFIHPNYFSGTSSHVKKLILISIFYTMIFLPVVTIFLLKQLKFITSFFLKTQQDRIIPYIACGVYFFWMYLVLKNNENVPTILRGFIFAVFLSSCVALIANIYYKISMHAIGAGGLIGIFLVVAQSNTMLMTWPLILALLIAGIICTSRMIISDHTQKEIYTGLWVGLICQFAGVIITI